MAEKNNNNRDKEFEQMMEQKIQANLTGKGNGATPSNERLKEMNKKLPSWSLEPPYSFIR